MDQGSSAFRSVSADVCWEGPRSSFSSDPHADQKLKKQVLDQSWYLLSDRDSDQRLYCSPRNDFGDFGDCDRDGHQVATPQGPN
jgi:hypothetical protein